MRGAAVTSDGYPAIRIGISAKPLHLYVAEVVDVGTKVGVSNAPTGRIADLSRAAQDFGRRLGRVWVSIRHPEALANERVLIGGWRRSEFLREPFEAVMARVDALPVTPSPVQQRSDWRLAGARPAPHDMKRRSK